MGRSGRTNFRYSRAEERAILTALESDLLDRVDRRAVLDAVTSAARTALVRHDPDPPYAGDAIEQLRRVAQASGALLEAIRALPSVEGWLHSDLANAYIEPALETDLRRFYNLGPVRLNALLVTLAESAKRAEPIARRLLPLTGRRQETALQQFILDLCEIYHRATERLPGMTRPTSASTTKRKGRFYPFVVAVVEPTGLGEEPYLDRPTRAATEAYRSLRGVPKRSHTRKAKTPKP